LKTLFVLIGADPTIENANGHRAEQYAKTQEVKQLLVNREKSVSIIIFKPVLGLKELVLSHDIVCFQCNITINNSLLIYA